MRNEPIVIFGDGNQTRDFIFVKDVVAANVHFASHSAPHGVFNVGCGHRYDSATSRRLPSAQYRKHGSQ